MSGTGSASGTSIEREIRGRWLGGYRVELVVRDGRFTLLSDEPPWDGGEDTGPMPSELLFASVASCFAMAIVWAARRARLDLPDLEVTVRGTAERSARRYGRIEITATSSVAVAEPEGFGQLMARARQICWITRTIEPGIPIDVQIAAPQPPLAMHEEKAGR